MPDQRPRLTLCGFGLDIKQMTLETVDAIKECDVVYSDALDATTMREDFKPANKLPFDFYYKFADEKGRESKLRILDWEIGMLFFNCVWRGDSDEVALNKVKQKYLCDVLNQEKRDVRLLVGTRGVHPNWLIIGIYNPPNDPNAGQQSFLDLA